MPSSKDISYSVTLKVSPEWFTAISKSFSTFRSCSSLKKSFSFSLSCDSLMISPVSGLISNSYSVVPSTPVTSYSKESTSKLISFIFAFGYLARRTSAASLAVNFTLGFAYKESEV